VLTNSQPVALTAGRWYLGVFNSDVTNVNYTILATEYGPPLIIPLVNGVPRTNTFPPGLSFNTFYSFTITNTNSSVLFELYNLSGNVDLTLNRGLGNLPYTQPPQFFATSARPGTNDEQIVVRTNATLGVYTTTNLNDIWYLGVPNNDNTSNTFTIRAVVDTNDLLISDVPFTISVTGSTNGPVLTWPTVAGQTYEILSSSNVTTPLINWTPLVTNSNAPPYLESFIDTNFSLSTPYMFYSIWQLPTP